MSDSYNRAMTFVKDEDGEVQILYATMIVPSCGCRIVGDGTLQHPLTVRSCDEHRPAMPGAWQK